MSETKFPSTADPVPWAKALREHLDLEGCTCSEEIAEDWFRAAIMCGYCDGVRAGIFEANAVAPKHLSHEETKDPKVWSAAARGVTLDTVDERISRLERRMDALSN